jgi:hypothetical protein
MAIYETGTATDTTDLITKLITFATANGWTVNTPLSGRVFTKGGLYYGLNWDVDDVWVAGATGYAAGSAWSAQPGASATQPRANDMAGPYQAYHFFTGTAPDYLHVVVETSAGIFKHFMFGQVVKHGTFTGGEYIGAVFWNMTVSGTAQNPNAPDWGSHAVPFDSNASAATAVNRSAVRADIDAKSNNWMVFRDADTYNGNYAKGVLRGKNTAGGSLYESLHARSPSEFNQVTPLLPILVAVDRPSSMTSPIGYAPDLRYVNMLNFAPGETVTIGGVEWMAFPLIQKTDTYNNASSAVPSSGTYGLAYRKN